MVHALPFFIGYNILVEYMVQALPFFIGYIIYIYSNGVIGIYLCFFEVLTSVRHHKYSWSFSKDGDCNSSKKIWGPLH